MMTLKQEMLGKKQKATTKNMDDFLKAVHRQSRDKAERLYNGMTRNLRAFPQTNHG